MEALGSVNDIVITPIKNPIAIKNAKTKKTLAINCKKNTCHTLIQKLFAKSRF